MPTKQQIRQALWSVQYFPQFRRHASPTATVVRDQLRALVLPIPLQQAIEHLVADYDEHDRTRRRRAFVKIGAAGLFDFRRLERFFGSSTEASKFRDSLIQLAQAFGLANVTEALQQRPQDVSAYVSKQLLAGAAIGDCIAADPTCMACLDGKTWDTTVTAASRVRRALEDLPAVLDPRSWPHCGDIFDKTDLVQWDPVPKKWVPYAGSMTATPIGSPWTTAKSAFGAPEVGMQEDVTVGATDSGGFVAAFSNVLNIDFAVSLGNPNPLDDAIRVDYSLNDPLSSVVFGQSVSGGLRNDEGYVLATREPTAPNDWSVIKVVKTVQFDDLTPTGGTVDYGELLNYMAPGILCLWLEDTSEMTPCCDL
jgi:hypothetical protein